ncbi:MAG TPA: hypothetical protein VHT30_08220 [Acidimicrobiales bacterium]|jgi:hypothetical protein|nr:hypothetical protein [Acidimicrobiales bacterium]
MRTADDGVVALVALAAILLCWLAAFRYVDQHRDADNAQLVDVLHLAALLRQQDAARWQAAANGSRGSTGLDLSAALASEAEINSRLAYLRRTGMAGTREATVAAPIDAVEADLHRLAGALAGDAATSAVEVRLSREVSDSANRLNLVAAPLRTSTGRDDVILDGGSAVALILPAVALAVLWLRRHLRGPPRPRLSTPPA